MGKYNKTKPICITYKADITTPKPADSSMQMLMPPPAKARWVTICLPTVTTTRLCTLILPEHASIIGRYGKTALPVRKKTKEEKICDAVINFSLALVEFDKGVKKVGSTVSAAYHSVDAYIGGGMGLAGKIEFFDYGEISLGIAYDEFGIRLNDGTISFGQHYFQGVGLSVGLPIFDATEDKFRDYTFSGMLPDFAERSTSNFSVWESSTHLGVGGTISIAFDIDYFWGRFKEIWTE